MCADFFGGCAVRQMVTSVWIASVGLPPMASALHHNGIIVDASREQGVKSSSNNYNENDNIHKNHL